MFHRLVVFLLSFVSISQTGIWKSLNFHLDGIDFGYIDSFHAGLRVLEQRETEAVPTRIYAGSDYKDQAVEMDKILAIFSFNLVSCCTKSLAL